MDTEKADQRALSLFIAQALNPPGECLCGGHCWLSVSPRTSIKAERKKGKRMSNYDMILSLCILIL